MINRLFSFNKARLNRLFPFYIAINRQLQVTDCGNSLMKMLPLTMPLPLHNCFTVISPAIKVTSLDDLQSLEDQLIELAFVGQESLPLKGQFEYLEQEDAIIFLGSPLFKSFNQLNERGLTLNDFARHDHLLDLLYILKAQELTNIELRELVDTINVQKQALKKANKAIKDVALFPLQNPDPLIRIDFMGNILSLNPAAKKLTYFEYKQEKSTQAVFLKKLAPQINKGNPRWTFDAISEGRNFSFVCKTLLREGYINIYGRDNTQEKKNEAALQQLSLVASANKNGVLFTGEDKKVFWCNEGFLKLTGYTQAEVMGKTPQELACGTTAINSSMHKLDNMLNGKDLFTHEGLHYHTKGNMFWVRLQAQSVSNAEGTDQYKFITIENITTERETQRQLKAYEERLKLALINVGDNYYEHDMRTGETVHYNPNDSLLGYPLQEVKDSVNFWIARTFEADKEKVIHVYEQYLAREIDRHVLEYRMIHKNGALLWVLDRGFIIEHDDAGNPIKMVGTHIDITKHKLLEAQLLQAKEAAEASANAKEMFLANISHEMRTPMNAITGMASQLAKTPLNNSQQFYLNIIRSAADNLLVIINDVLDLSKIEAGKLSLEQIGFEPQMMINHTMRVMMQRALEKSLVFTNSFCDSALHPVLIGDPHRLNQILLNLVSNAIKFTEKGKVDIRCYVTGDSPTAQTIKIVVQDTGIGMTASFVETLFQKFTQEDDSVTRRFGGTGLGMSICKQLLDLMGGTIIVTSEKGKGTTMSISIDFAKGVHEDLPQKNNPLINEQVFTGKKIMVVDDNEMNRVVAQIMLESYGAHITVAIDGIDAVAKASTDFDIILMDIQMPQMDGLEATRLIRQKIGPSIPIIALTAMALKGNEEKIRKAGMQGYLYKPFEEVQLLSIIANQLKTEQPTLTPIAQSQPLTDNMPLFSMDKLNNITKNNPAFTQRLLQLFMEQAPAAMHTMQAAYQQGDFVLIQKTAHRLIASIDNMGIEVLKQEIRDIEKNAAIYGISPQLEDLLNYVDDVIKKIVLQIKNYVE